MKSCHSAISYQHLTPTSRRLLASPFVSCRPTLPRRSNLLRAQGDEVEGEAAFEKRLADMKKAKGEMPFGESRKNPSEAKEDFSQESLFYEGGPHTGDLLVNVLLGFTLIWLPLTVAAITRKAFVKYKVTDKRISVTTEAPWKNEQLDVAYKEVKDVVAVGRGVGVWGDMVVTLKNGDKIEIRSLDRWQEIKDYVMQQAEATRKSASSENQSPSGFS